VQRFKNRLSAVNMLHLKRLVVFLDATKKAMSAWRDERVAALKNKQQKLEKSEVLTVVDFMGRLGKKASSINLLEIESYLKKSKVGTVPHSIPRTS
jgi:chromosome transmission fidelity protein 1